MHINVDVMRLSPHTKERVIHRGKCDPLRSLDLVRLNWDQKIVLEVHNTVVREVLGCVQRGGHSSLFPAIVGHVPSRNQGN